MNYPDADYCEDWASKLIGGPHYPSDDAHILWAYGPGGDCSECVREDVRDGSMKQTHINGQQFRGTAAYRILAALRQCGPITAQAMAMHLDLKYHTVKTMLQRLRRAGAVSYEVRAVPCQRQRHHLFMWYVTEEASE